MYLDNQNAEKQRQIDTMAQELTSNQEQIQQLNEDLVNIRIQLKNQEDEYGRFKEEVSRSMSRRFNVTVTAYDLSINSCGVPVGCNGYGMTASGFDLTGHSLESARAIAVDPNIIPLGSKVRIKFKDPEWQHLNGIYNAVDTGGAIVGNRIDLFYGDFGTNETDQSVWNFGRREAIAEIL